MIRIELLRTPAELHALQLVQKVLQAVILRQHLIALCDRRITLSARNGGTRHRTAVCARSKPTETHPQV